MPDIIDIVQRLTYQVEDSELQKGVTELQKQIQAVVNYGTRVANLEKALAQTAQNDIQRRQRLTALINQNRQAVDNQNAAIQRTISGNRALQDGLAREIGLINTLNMRINTLREARNSAGTAGQIRDINRELAQLEGNLSRLQSSGRGGSILGNIGSGVIQGLGLAGGLGVASIVGKGSEFIQESGKLAAEVEGVSRAFQNLNQPDLLDNLRSATKGTVSDLELMKKAIQFSNFGLPVEKLGIAFEFARRRAKDTGESVEYLVQSIVTGIGRQSPLILDNLGINAKRVRDEFLKIGNFSEAAFKIIQEESAKAGADLESFSEIEARLAAQIENQQAKLGQYYNVAKGYLYAFLQDAVSGNPYALNISNFRNAQKQIEEAKENQVYANKIADKQYLLSFQKFNVDYAQADFNGRAKIKDQAQKNYEELTALAKVKYAEDEKNLKIHLLALQSAYQRFNQGLKTPINLGSLTPAGLRGLSAQQLNDVRDQITQSSGSLTRGDKGTIDNYRALNKAIDDELKALDTGTQSTKEADKAAEKYKKTLEELKLTIKEVSKSIRDIDKEFDAESKRLDAEDAKASKLYNDFFTGAEGRFGETLQNERRTSPDSPGKLQADLETQQKEKANRKKQDEIDDKKQKERIEAIRSSYENLAAVLQTINSLYQQRGQLLDTQFNNQQERVRQAEILAERGNVAELKREQDKLDKLAKAREDNARQQLQINALLQASNSAVALTEAIGAIVSAAAKGDPYTIAARVIAAVAALVGGVASLKAAFTGFEEGGFTGYKGTKEVAGVVHGQEFVMDAQNTAKYRPILEQMHKGSYPPLTPIYQQSTLSTKKVEKKLDTLIGAVEDNAFKQNIRFDRDGMRIFTESQIRRERKRWK